MDFKTFTFDTSENLEMTPIDWSSKIASNKESFGQCDMDTAADIINNEEKLKNPATYYMFNPVETDPNGAIKQEELKELYEKDGMGGVVATLVNSRLYPLYAPARTELRQLIWGTACKGASAILRA